MGTAQKHIHLYGTWHFENHIMRYISITSSAKGKSQQLVPVPTHN